MDDAHRLLLRTLERFEERVEETDVAVRQVETGRVFAEEGLELVALGGQHGLPPLLDQFFRRGALLRGLGGRQDFAEPRETQSQQPVFGKYGAQDRQEGDHAEDEQDDLISFHASSFQTLRYSCRAHISSR